MRVIMPGLSLLLTPAGGRRDARLRPTWSDGQAQQAPRQRAKSTEFGLVAVDVAPPTSQPTGTCAAARSPGPGPIVSRFCRDQGLSRDSSPNSGSYGPLRGHTHHITNVPLIARTHCKLHPKINVPSEIRSRSVAGARSELAEAGLHGRSPHSIMAAAARPLHTTTAPQIWRQVAGKGGSGRVRAISPTSGRFGAAARVEGRRQTEVNRTAGAPGGRPARDELRVAPGEPTPSRLEPG